MRLRAQSASTELAAARLAADAATTKSQDLKADLDRTVAEWQAKVGELEAESKAKYAALGAEWQAKQSALEADWQAKHAELGAEWQAKQSALEAEWQAKYAELVEEWQAKQSELEASKQVGVPPCACAGCLPLAAGAVWAKQLHVWAFACLTATAAACDRPDRAQDMEASNSPPAGRCRLSRTGSWDGGADVGKLYLGI